MQHLTPIWYFVISIAIVAAIINFGLAAARRSVPMVALVRGVAGFISLGLAAAIIIGKSITLAHPYLPVQEVIIGFGVFIFAVMFLPNYVERGTSPSETVVTMQQRAARPTNATVRLSDLHGTAPTARTTAPAARTTAPTSRAGSAAGAGSASDEWVN